MKTFTLKNKFQTNATLVANDFIDHYMVQANGEFVWNLFFNVNVFIVLSLFSGIHTLLSHAQRYYSILSERAKAFFQGKICFFVNNPCG